LRFQGCACAAGAKPTMTLRVIALFFWLRPALRAFTSLRDVSLRR